MLLKGQQGLKKDWGFESAANWVHANLPAFETRYFPFMSLCHSFLANLVLQTKVRGRFVCLQPVADLLLY